MDFFGNPTKKKRDDIFTKLWYNSFNRNRKEELGIIYEKMIGWAIPFICGACVSGLLTYMKMISKREKALSAGVRCLLRAEIISYHDKYFALSYCPIYAKESLKRIYSAYHDLGGNDVATQLYDKTMELPEKSECPTSTAMEE